MHVAEQLFVESFDVEVDGRQVGPDGLFPDWGPLDRLGVVVDEPLGALGASMLIQLSIALWFDARPARRDIRPAYPEFVVFHVGGPHGDFSYFDAWPPRKEIRIERHNPLDLLAAINGAGVTRLALPDGPDGDPAVLENGPSVWAEQASANDRLASCFCYSPTGVLEAGGLRITSTDKRVRANIAQTLEPLEEVLEIRQSVERDGPDSVPEDDARWAEHVIARAPEVDTERRDHLSRIHLSDPHRITQTYRRSSTSSALARLAAL